MILAAAEFLIFSLFKQAFRASRQLAALVHGVVRV